MELPELHVGLVELSLAVVSVIILFARLEFNDSKQAKEIDRHDKKIDILSKKQSEFELQILEKLSEIKVSLAVGLQKIEELLENKKGRK